MHEHESEQTTTVIQTEPAPLPSCCGTGCAVCVLDYVEEHAKQAKQAEQIVATEPSGRLAQETQNGLPGINETGPRNENPQCCNTGCIICVRDYPELFHAGFDAALVPLLEAVEQAQQLFADSQNETQSRVMAQSGE